MASDLTIDQALRARADSLGFRVGAVVASYLRVLFRVLVYTPGATEALDAATVALQTAYSKHARCPDSTVAEHQRRIDGALAAWWRAFRVSNPLATYNVLSEYDFVYHCRLTADGQVPRTPPCWCDVLALPQRGQELRATARLESDDWEVLINALRFLCAPVASVRGLVVKNSLRLRDVFKQRAAPSFTWASRASPSPPPLDKPPPAIPPAVLQSADWDWIPTPLQPLSEGIRARVVTEVRNERIGHDRSRPVTLDDLLDCAARYHECVVAVRTAADVLHAALIDALNHYASIHAGCQPMLDAFVKDAVACLTLADAVIADLTQLQACPRVVFPDHWRLFMASCRHFKHSDDYHILLMHPGLRSDPALLTALGRIPARIVMNFDTNDDGTVVSAFQSSQRSVGSSRKVHGLSVIDATRHVQLDADAAADAADAEFSEQSTTVIVSAGHGVVSTDVSVRNRVRELRDLAKVVSEHASALHKRVHVTWLAVGDYGRGGRDSASFVVNRTATSIGILDDVYPRLAKPFIKRMCEDDPHLRTAFVCDASETVEAGGDFLFQSATEEAEHDACTVALVPTDILRSGLAACVYDGASSTTSIRLHSRHGYAISWEIWEDGVANVSQQLERWASLGLTVLHDTVAAPPIDNELDLAREQQYFLSGMPASWRLLNHENGIAPWRSARDALVSDLAQAVRDAEFVKGFVPIRVRRRHHPATGATTLARSVLLNQAARGPVVVFEPMQRSPVQLADAIRNFVAIATATSSTVIVFADSDVDAEMLSARLTEQAGKDNAPRFVLLQFQRVGSILYHLPSRKDEDVDELRPLTPAEVSAWRAWKESCWKTIQAQPAQDTQQHSAPTWLQHVFARAPAVGEADPEIVSDAPAVVPDALFLGFEYLIAYGNAEHTLNVWKRLHPVVQTCLTALRNAATREGELAAQARGAFHAIRMISFLQLFAHSTVPANLLSHLLSTAVTDIPGPDELHRVVQAAVHRHLDNASGMSYMAAPVPRRSALSSAAALRDILTKCGADFVVLFRQSSSHGVVVRHMFVAIMILFTMAQPDGAPSSLDEVFGVLRLACGTTALDFILNWVCCNPKKPVSLDKKGLTAAVTRLLYDRAMVSRSKRAEFAALVDLLRERNEPSREDLSTVISARIMQLSLTEAMQHQLRHVLVPSVALLYVAQLLVDGAAPKVHLIRLIMKESIPTLPFADEPKPLTFHDDRVLTMSLADLEAVRRHAAAWCWLTELGDELTAKYPGDKTALDTVGMTWTQFLRYFVMWASNLHALSRTELGEALRSTFGASHAAIMLRVMFTEWSVTRYLEGAYFCYQQAMDLFRRERDIAAETPYPYANALLVASHMLRAGHRVATAGAAWLREHIPNVVRECMDALKRGYHCVLEEGDRSYLHTAAIKLLKTMEATKAVGVEERIYEQARATGAKIESIELAVQFFMLKVQHAFGSHGRFSPSVMLTVARTEAYCAPLRAFLTLLCDRVGNCADAGTPVPSTTMNVLLNVSPWFADDHRTCPSLDVMSRCLSASDDSFSQLARVCIAFCLLLHRCINDSRGATGVSRPAAGPAAMELYGKYCEVVEGSRPSRFAAHIVRSWDPSRSEYPNLGMVRWCYAKEEPFDDILFLRARVVRISSPALSHWRGSVMLIDGIELPADLYSHVTAAPAVGARVIVFVFVGEDGARARILAIDVPDGSLVVDADALRRDGQLRRRIKHLEPASTQPASTAQEDDEDDAAVEDKTLLFAAAPGTLIPDYYNSSASTDFSMSVSDAAASLPARSGTVATMPAAAAPAEPAAIPAPTRAGTQSTVSQARTTAERDIKDRGRRAEKRLKSREFLDRLEKAEADLAFARELREHAGPDAPAAASADPPDALETLAEADELRAQVQAMKDLQARIAAK